jgi:chloramphenicol 3-O phosphotransferase
VIVVLNGAPRSGKSSIARVMQKTFDGIWMNIGVDIARAMTPPAVQPGIGLRPGEPDHPATRDVPRLYAALWESVAAHERLGLNVVVDCGIYEPATAADAKRRLAGLPVTWVGVRCPLDVLEARGGRQRWHDAVHTQLRYDLEVDTAVLSPDECAAKIGTFLA